MESRKGQYLGHYQLQKLLGQGSFATVYRAKDTHLQRTVAIKILKGRIVDQASRQAFLQEARTVAQLRHPNIVKVLAFDVKDNTPFLVMDWAPNGSLRLTGVQPLETIIPYVQQAAAGLDYAHNQKLIHRDVKPENMLSGYENEVLLSDFGLVKLAQSSNKQLTGDMVGTPCYMAPEQALGKPCFASDQYALGIVVYEWLTGGVPFQGDSPLIVANQHLHIKPPSPRLKNPDIPVSLERVLLKALAKDSSERFATVQEFAEAFTQASQFTTFFSASPRQVDDDEEFISTFVKPQTSATYKALEEEEDVLFPVGQAQQDLLLMSRATRVFSSQLPRLSQSYPSQQSPNADSSTILRTSSEQSTQRRSQDYLRWLILGCALAGTLLLPGGLFLQQPQIWVVGVFLVATSAVLGVLQTIQRDQWFWFIGFTCFSPLTGLFYGIVNPNTKANPPASMRQLILITACVGWLFFAGGAIIGFAAQNTLGALALILAAGGLDLLLNHWLLAWIRAKKLGENTGDFPASIASFGPFWYGLASIWNDNRDF